MNFNNLKSRYESGKIHFIGIGGIGMSAIALILKKIGCNVCGSDQAVNNNIKTLQQKEVQCFYGHDAKNITDDIVAIVATSIIKPDNPEIIAAKEKNIPILRRADMLAQIMQEKLGITIAGTHGKTSTTAMVAVLLDVAEIDPMVINGGIINYFGSNAKFGNGKFLVAESDESDGTFVELPSFIGAITNIEPEHLEFYDGDFEKVKSYYKKYITQIPSNGMAAICIDNIEAEKVYNEISQTKTNLVSLSTVKDADICANNISTSVSGVLFDAKIKKSGQILKDIKISAYGLHNVQNALIAIAIGNFLGLDGESIKKGLAKYSGVQRRFTKVGEIYGATIIDDYGHHPTEISATFKAAKQVLGKNNKLIVVFQPHKYSRTKDLFKEFCNSFNDVDIAIIADIYTTGQKPIIGAGQDDLICGIKETGHKNVIKLHNKDELPELIKKYANSGDMVIYAGAGDISSWAHELPHLCKN